MPEAKVAKKKAVAKKAPVKKVIAVEEEAEAIEEVKASATVAFYFPKENAGFTWDTGKGVIRVKGVNNVITLLVGEDDFAIEQLRKDEGNKANGGGRFVEVESRGVMQEKVAEQIDQLIEMDNSAIVAMLGGEMTLRRLSKGALIAKVLKLD